MTLFHSFYLLSLQVMEKLNLAFWTFAYFYNWISWCYFLLQLSNFFSMFSNCMYSKKMIGLEKFIYKYFRLAH